MSGEPDALLPALVARWFDRTPDAVAVRQDDESRTYAELDAFSARVAAGLVASGCGAEDRVALVIERTVDLPAVILGVLRAGCSYVPLDPTHPAERLAEVIVDSGTRVVLTDVDPLPVRPADGVVVLALAELPDGVAPADRAPHPDQIAYVLYTSGSAGRPKGVCVTHAGLANCVIGTMESLRPNPGDRLLGLTTISFDIATLELFVPLASGGQVVLTRTAESRSGEALGALVRRWRPRFLHATPTSWELMFIAGWEGDPDLVAMCGGDVVSSRLAARLSACTARVWHLYGPTETTMYSVCQPLEAGPQRTVLPIGTAIRGTVARVLDERLRAVPDGEVGELCLNGVGVARGYVGRPRLTAERFVPDPEVPGGRLYRTGDLARVLPDGTLELRGRADLQVKIRGHRVEPGEVEHVLAGHPDVARAAVVAVGERGVEQRLVAFVQPHHGPPTRELLTGVRAFAESRLPAAMAPSSYAGVPSIPMTRNGKVDRALLARVRPPALAAVRDGREDAPPDGRRDSGPPPLVVVTRNAAAYQDWVSATEQGRPVLFVSDDPDAAIADGALVTGWGLDAVTAFRVATRLDHQPPLLLVAPAAPPDTLAGGPYTGKVHFVLPLLSDVDAWSSLAPRGRIIRVPGDAADLLRGNGARRLAAVVAHLH